MLRLSALRLLSASFDAWRCGTSESACSRRRIWLLSTLNPATHTTRASTLRNSERLSDLIGAESDPNPRPKVARSHIEDNSGSQSDRIGVFLTRRGLDIWILSQGRFSPDELGSGCEHHTRLSSGGRLGQSSSMRRCGGRIEMWDLPEPEGFCLHRPYPPKPRTAGESVR